MWNISMLRIISFDMEVYWSTFANQTTSVRFASISRFGKLVQA